MVVHLNHKIIAHCDVIRTDELECDVRFLYIVDAIVLTRTVAECSMHGLTLFWRTCKPIKLKQSRAASTVLIRYNARIRSHLC